MFDVRECIDGMTELCAKKKKTQAYCIFANLSWRESGTYTRDRSDKGSSAVAWLISQDSELRCWNTGR